MKRKTIDEISERYDLELDKVVSEIIKNKAKLVLLQFPDGLKLYSNVITNYLKDKFNGNVEFLIWLGTCFGACDTPIGLEDKKMGFKIDLVIQFGHSSMMPIYLN